MDLSNNISYSGAFQGWYKSLPIITVAHLNKYTLILDGIQSASEMWGKSLSKK